MIKRTQPIYDSVQVHTGLAANTELSFFTAALNQQANQQTTGSDTPYRKSEYHTNNKLAQTERGQSLLIRGFDIWCDEYDSFLLAQMFLDSKSYFQFYVGDDKVFQYPLEKMVCLKSGGMAIGLADDSTAATKGQKLGIIIPENDYFKLDYGIEVPELRTFKAIIKNTAAVTFKKLTFDFAVAAANAAYTTPFNVFVGLRTDETKN